MRSKIRVVLLDCGGWAVLAVLFLHRLVMVLGLRAQSDALMHYSGGLAITYAAYRTIGKLACWFGTQHGMARVFIAFTTGCTAAVLWELIEFGSDVFLATHVQKSLHETMLDLVFGVTGATTFSVFAWLFRGGRQGK